METRTTGMFKSLCGILADTTKLKTNFKSLENNKKGKMRIYQETYINDLAIEIKQRLDNVTETVDKVAKYESFVDNDNLRLIENKINANPIAFANQLFESIHSNLQIIKSHVGAQDNFYKQASQALAHSVGMIVGFGLVEPYSISATKSSFDKNDPIIIQCKQKLSSASTVLQKLESYSLPKHMKDEIYGVLTMIKQTESRLNPSTGCFIATHVYGSYNSKEVIQFRHFRDSYLNTFYFGRLLIDIYYKVSPSLVKSLGRFDIFNKVSKYLLNHILVLLGKYIK